MLKRNDINGVIAAVLLVLLQGCVVPVGVPTSEFGLVAGKGQITEQTLKNLSTPEATRERMLLMFGRPDFTSDNQKIFLYRWATQKDWGGPVVMIPAGPVTLMGYSLSYLTGTLNYLTR